MFELRLGCFSFHFAASTDEALAAWSSDPITDFGETDMPRFEADVVPDAEVDDFSRASWFKSIAPTGALLKEEVTCGAGLNYVDGLRWFVWCCEVGS